MDNLRITLCTGLKHIIDETFDAVNLKDIQGCFK